MLKKKSGYSAINVIIGMLIILLCFNLLIEFSLLGYRYSYMAQTSSYVARTIGRQGGISNSRPDGFPANTTYVTSNALFWQLNQGFERAGFDTFVVRINGIALNSGTRVETPEKERIVIDISAGFNPIFNFRGNSSRVNVVTTRRIIYSSFQVRTTDLDLEK